MSMNNFRFGHDYIMLHFGKNACLGCNNSHMTYGPVFRLLGDKVNVVVLIGEKCQCCSQNVLQDIQKRGGTIIVSDKVENLAGYYEGIRVYDSDTLKYFPEKFIDLLAKTKPKQEPA